MPGTTVNSFVVRFVQETPVHAGDGFKPWRGIIRHVQSNQETNFAHLEDALFFMQGFVDIGDENRLIQVTGAE